MKLKLAFLPSNYEVRLRITAIAKSPAKAAALISSAEKLIRKGAGRYIYGDDERSIGATVGTLLKKRKLTISAAESCTGGLILSKLTDIPGSSDYVMDGIVSYADSAKVRLLGVNPSDIKKYGAVSKTVAMQMAEGIRKTLKNRYRNICNRNSRSGRRKEEQACWAGVDRVFR